MRDLLPFIGPALGLFWVVDGAWKLLATFRRVRQTAACMHPSTGSPGRSSAGQPPRLRRQRNSGIFWLCVGIATLWFSNNRIVTVVGIFWIAAGTGSLFLSLHRGKLLATEPANISLATTYANPNVPVRNQRRAGLFWLCLGFATLWFSDVHFGTSPAVAEPRETDSSIAEIVTQQVQRGFQKQGYVGMVVGAVARDREVLLGFGRERLGNPLPPHADTVFEIGSITKVFTGILLAKHLESEALQLDDRLVELLPEGWSLPDAAQDITLRHCTTHTSGIPRLPSNLMAPTNAVRALLGGDPYRGYGEHHFREAVSTVELEFPPGTEHLYSNFAVGLLGHVLSVRNGTDYETLVSREICHPLGLSRTVVTNSDWHLAHRATGYRATVKVGSTIVALESAAWQLPNHLAGAGAICSTGGDMLRFLKANMGLIPTSIDASLRRSHQEQYRESTRMAMGINWIRSFDSSLAQNILWHNGGTGGYRSYLGFTEDLHFGVVVLSNTNHSVDELAESLLKELVRQAGESR